MITNKEYNDIFKQEVDWIQEVINCNIKLVNSIGASEEDIITLLDGCRVTDKMKMVDKPKGDDQSESHDLFKSVHILQWSIGLDGDSFEGEIYAEIEENKWLMIPYQC